MPAGDIFRPALGLAARVLRERRLGRLMRRKEGDMALRSACLRSVALLGAAVIWSAMPIAAKAQGDMGGIGTIEFADPSIEGEGTMSPAAAALWHGLLPTNPAEAEFQAGLNRVVQEALRMRSRDGMAPSEDSVAVGSAAARRPSIDRLRGGGGPRDRVVSPPSGTAAAGTDRTVFAVNRRAEIHDKSVVDLSNFPLQDLAGLPRAVPVSDPALIWDDDERFYYAMVAAIAEGDFVLAFGFSKDATPNNRTPALNNLADWCHYTYGYATRRPNFVRLGDNKDFIIITANGFQPSFVGTDITAISKPPPGPTCPDPATFKKGTAFSVRDTDGVLVASAVAVNQIDDLDTGYALAREGSVFGGGADKLWLYNVTKHPTTGDPVFSSARGISVPVYSSPPGVAQPNSSRLLFALDARLTNAVQARNPDRAGKVYSIWTQHTVGHVGPRSVVRWYEINPTPAVPAILRSGSIGSEPAFAGTFFFNGAISPDRVRDGSTTRFGNSFVIHYNVSSSVNNINPRIDAASSVRGGPLSSRIVKKGKGPYKDFSCPGNADLCQWGGAAAAPDPTPPTDRPRLNRGMVWGINQYSGVLDPPTTAGNAQWRTWIFAVQP